MYFDFEIFYFYLFTCERVNVVNVFKMYVDTSEWTRPDAVVSQRSTGEHVVWF